MSFELLYSDLQKYILNFLSTKDLVTLLSVNKNYKKRSISVLKTRIINCSEFPQIFYKMILYDRLDIVKCLVNNLSFNFRFWCDRSCTIAVSAGYLDILIWLRTQNPPFPWYENTCTETAEKGYLKILKWLRSQDPPCPWDIWHCGYAAIRGNHVTTSRWIKFQYMLGKEILGNKIP